jgi:hypothetical protein
VKLDMSTYEPFGLEAIETASRDEIAALQTVRLKRTLANVYENVPAYRKKFDAAGVIPSDFRRLEDLEKFPFTTKQDLRENYPFGMLAVPKERVARVQPRPAPRASRRSSATRETTSTRGLTWLRGRFAQAASGPACSFTSRSDTACSPAVSACTTVQSGSDVR